MDIFDTQSDIKGPQCSEQWYRTIIDYTYDWELWFNQSGIIEYISPSCKRITGYRAADFLGDPDLLKEIVHPDDRSNYEQHLFEMKEKTAAGDLEYRIMHRDGRIRWIHHVCCQAVDAGGNPLGRRISNRDVTEIKETIEKLNSSQRRYHSLFEKNPAVILLIDPETGEIADANSAACRFYGYRHEEIIRLNIDQINTLPLETLKQKMKDAVRHKSRAYHFQHRLAAGEIRHVSVKVGFIEVDGRELLYSIVHDETDQVIAEQELSQSRQRLEAVLEVMPVAVFIADAEGRMIASNPAAKTIWGGPTPLPANPTLYDCYRGWWADTGKPLRAHDWGLARAVENGEASGPEEIEIECFDDSHKYIFNYAVPIKDNRDKIADAVSVNVDVTERKQMANELERRERDFYEAFEYAPIGMHIMDMEGRFLHVNPAFCRITGFTEHELLHEISVKNLFHPDDIEENCQLLESLLAGEIPALFAEKRYIRKDGKATWVRIQATVDWDAEGEPFQIIALVEDINQRKYAEKLLKQSRDELTRQVQDRNVELENRLQQLRLLRSELTHAEKNERERLAKVLHDHLQQLIVAAKRDVSIISSKMQDDSLKELAREASEYLTESIETSRSLSVELMPPVLQERGLIECMEWLCQWFREKHKLAVTLETSPDADITHEEIKLLVFESVREMLFNVVKHAEVSEARVQLYRCNDSFCVTVSDKGRGFDPAALAQEDTSLQAHLGLSSIRKRIALLKGHLEIDSAPEKGTTLALLIPLTVESLV